jgi:hypothetical protein
MAGVDAVNSPPGSNVAIVVDAGAAAFPLFLMVTTNFPAFGPVSESMQKLGGPEISDRPTGTKSACFA